MAKLKKSITSALALTMLAGCSSSTAASEKTSSSSGGANNDVVTIATATDVISWDTCIATDGTSFLAQMMFTSGLMWTGEDGLPECDLAEDYTVSDDGLVYTFTIRDDAVWSNGDPVTANDFVYAWRRLIDPDTASEYNWMLSTMNVKGAEAYDPESGAAVEDLGIVALDDKTLEITLTKPTGYFLSLLAFPTQFPLNEEYVEGLGDQYATSADNLLSCGAYVIKDWTPGESYSFVLNENYWDYDNMVADGIVNEVDYRVIQDTQTALMEYEAGNMQVVTLSGEQVTANKDSDGYTAKLNAFNFYLSCNINNTDDETLKSVNVRKAMSYALDRDTIADSLNDGSIAAEGIIPFELASNPDGSGNDFRADNGALVSYDVDEAKKYYEEACEELGTDSISIELLYGSDEGDSVIKAAEQIQSFLEAAGFEVSLNAKPKKERLNLMSDHDYQVALTRWGPDYADPQTYMDLFVSTNTSNNSGGYDSEEYDALVAEAESGTVSDVDRWNDFLEAEKVLISEDMAVIPVYQSGGAMLISPDITGIVFHQIGGDDYKHIKYVK